MSFKQYLITLIPVILMGCSSNPIEKPPVLEEYQQPFVHTQYQTQPTSVTQQVIKNNSDVAHIVNEPEYVFWVGQSQSLFDTKTSPIPIATGPHVVENTAPQSSAEQVSSAKEASKPDLTTTTKKRLPIYCDLDKQKPCGTLNICDDMPCRLEHMQFYECDSDSCIPIYLVKHDFTCREKYSQVNPDCLGKGDGHCVSHPELDFCNMKAE